jgi:hypothetical protein
VSNIDYIMTSAVNNSIALVTQPSQLLSPPRSKYFPFLVGDDEVAFAQPRDFLS